MKAYLFALLMLCTLHAQAATFCANTGNELNIALAMSGINDEDDEIRVATGVHITDYHAPQAYQWQVRIASLVDHEKSLVISGGWSNGDNCATQSSLNPIDTILDARFWGPVFVIDLTNSIPDTQFVGTFSISNLTFNRGENFFDGQATGLNIFGPLAPPGSVIVDNVHALGGRTAKNAASALGMNIFGSGTVRVRNSNVSINTLSGANSVPAFIGIYDNVVGFVSNNSIYDNSVTSLTSGLVVRNTATVSNNAVADNVSTADPNYQFFSDIPTALTLVNNHFETEGFFNGSPFSEAGTTTGAPLWTGVNVWRIPNAGSPLLDSGENTPVGGALDIDHLGNPRIQNVTIDRGSIEGAGGPPSQNRANVTVTKSFSDNNPEQAQVTLSCEGIAPANISPSTNYASESSPAIFVVNNLSEGTTQCTATEIDPMGYTAVSSTCQTTVEPGVNGECGITNIQDPVEFLVQKTFDDSNPVASATVTLACVDVDAADVTTNKGTAELGSPASFTVSNFPYQGTNCTATETVVPVGYTPASLTCQDAIGLANDGACTLENIQDPVIIQAAKVYSGGGGGAVDFAVECTNLDGGTVSPADTGASPGFPAHFEVNDFMWDGSTLCTVTEPIPPSGYWATENTCVDLSIVPSNDPVECAITNAPTRATFKVTKYFDDGNNVDEIEVAIDCNTGLILDQDKDLGDDDSVTFVVTSFDEGTLNCTITEDGQAGYSGSYYNVSTGSVTNDSCEYLQVGGGDEFECQITNFPLAVDVNITKEWIFEGSGSMDINTDYWLTLYCDAEILNGYRYRGDVNVEDGAGFNGGGCGHGGGSLEGGQDGGIYADWCKTYSGDSPDTFTAQVIPEFPNSSCYVYEKTAEDFIEVENGCMNITISANNGDSCKITNTVFYEGIPTLSQYGMALMALLMLGVGFVSFRRLS